MPKSNFLKKKSKTGSTADFKRLKGKVGKRAPQAASHTDTSFKSKRVRVSAQSILNEVADGEAVTARGQGVQELLIQLRHYSPVSKREALLGLKSIVDRNPIYAEVNFARLAEGSLELTVCLDGDVRKTLLTYQEALLGCVPAVTFAPFANIYLAYVVSAMTNLDRSVRRDSLGLLSLLLARFPAAVAERAERVVPNYTTLLALDPGSKKQTGRTEALKSVVALFRAVSRRHRRSGSVNDAGNRISVVVKAGTLSAARLLWKRGWRRNGALILSPRGSPVVMTERDRGSIGGGGVDAGGVAGASATKALASMLPQMLVRLREIWMEALATVPPDIGLLQCVADVLLEAVASPAWTADAGSSKDEDVYNGVLTSSACGVKRRERSKDDLSESSTNQFGVAKSASASIWFARFVPLLLEAFPIRPLEGELLGDMEAERLQAIERLNMTLCELVVAASTGSATATEAAKAAGARGLRGAEEDEACTWLQPILEHVHEVLRDGSEKGCGGAQISSVLRVLSAALHSPPGKRKGYESWTAQRQRLLSGFGDFFSSSPPRSEAKLLCVKFICALTMTQFSRSRSGSILNWQQAPTAATEDEVVREVRRWLQSLPELLCRWEGDFLEASAAVLQAFVEVAKRAPSPPTTTSPSATGAESTGVKLKGSTVVGTGARAKGALVAASTAAMAAAGGKTEVLAVESAELLRSIQPAVLAEFFSGRSFLSLPVSAQMDAISLLFHLPSIPVGVMSALAAACSDPMAVHRHIRSFILEVMHHRRRSLTPSVYLGFLVSVLTGVVTVKHVGGSKRTAAATSEGDNKATGDRGGGKRRRQKSSNKDAVLSSRQEVEAAAMTDEGQPEGECAAPRSLWDTVFLRDEVTGAVCNSLAMVGTRGGALLEALHPTLLQLLAGQRRASGARQDARATVTNESYNDNKLAISLQGQRAAMACVLCCWEGLDVEPSTFSPQNRSFASATPTAATTTPAAHSKSITKSPSALSTLEQPVAKACVQAMRAAGRVDASEQARSTRLLRPVLVLVKRWPALLSAVLTSIVTSVTEAVESRSVEPLVRCLQMVVRDPGLQGQLRRRHTQSLQSAAAELSELLDGSPLRSLVAQLRADVELLGGGRSR